MHGQVLLHDALQPHLPATHLQHCKESCALTSCSLAASDCVDPAGPCRTAHVQRTTLLRACLAAASPCPATAFFGMHQHLLSWSAVALCEAVEPASHWTCCHTSPLPQDSAWHAACRRPRAPLPGTRACWYAALLPTWSLGPCLVRDAACTPFTHKLHGHCVRQAVICCMFCLLAARYDQAGRCWLSHKC
jgi:hypothetical protein